MAIGRVSSAEETTTLSVRGFNFFYGNTPVLKNVTMDIYEGRVTALIGPSGCGKTTFLRTFNRMHDLYPGNRYEGEIIHNGENLLKVEDLIALRGRLGMVFQRPTPFPMSIFDNIAYGLRLGGLRNRSEIAGRVEKALKDAALWNEVEDRLKHSAMGLSGGQQQRLVIARALAVEPEILLLDEPTSALDPIATNKIEELVVELKEKVSIVMVTHNMHQAARLSDYTAFMYLGELIEYGGTDKLFTHPREEMTERYVRGMFG